MDNQKLIIGSGLFAAGVVAAKGLLVSGGFTKPLIGVFFATVLLAVLDSAGLGAIAAPLAYLFAAGMFIVYGLPILAAIGGKTDG